MIFQNSRYATATLESALTSNGQTVMAVYLQRQATPKRIAYSEYVIKEGDRLDRLAAQFFGDPTQWWRIANINPEVFYPEGDLPLGTVLRIPRANTLSAV